MTTFCGKNIRKFNDEDKLYDVGQAAATEDHLSFFAQQSKTPAHCPSVDQLLSNYYY